MRFTLEHLTAIAFATTCIQFIAAEQGQDEDDTIVAQAPSMGPDKDLDTICPASISSHNIFQKYPCNDTVGKGAMGFGGLSWTKAILRWMQANRAPDLIWIDLVNDALPVFIGFMFLEYVVARLQGKTVYYFRQAVGNAAAMAAMFGLLGVFAHGLSVFPYIALHKSFAVYSEKNLFSHLIAFFGVDFCYYWSHRFGHATNLGWGTHGSHHSSPDFNYSTGIRSSTHEVMVSWIFYLPLAFVVHPDVYFFHHGITYVAQFCLHTQVIGSLGPLEWFFNTPSHHRVHHARNYPSANFGGALIIFDRLFGTFTPERPERPCVYGLDTRKKTMGTHNVYWHNIQHLYCTVKVMLRSKNPLRVLLSREHCPGMIQPDITGYRDGPPKLPADGIPCDDEFGWYDMYFIVQTLLFLGPVILTATHGSESLPLWETLFFMVNGGLSLFVLMCGFDMEATAVRNELLRLALVAISFTLFLDKPYCWYVIPACAISAVAAVKCLQHDMKKLEGDKKRSQ